MIFLDTPGIHKGRSELNQRMVQTAVVSGRDADVLLFMIEATSPLIEEDREMESVLVSGITYRTDEGKVTIIRVPDKPGVAARIFGPLSEAGIIVDMIIQDVSEEGFTNMTFTVSKGDMPQTLAIMEDVGRDLGAKGLTSDEDIAKVSIIGAGMRTHSGVASKMFGALASEGINIQMISTSEIKISCVIEAKYMELAVRVLHKAFGLGDDAIQQARPLRSDSD